MKNIIRILVLAAAFLGTSPAFAACTGQFLGGTLCANATSAQGIPGPSANPVLGVPGTNTGTLGFAGSGSGTATVSAQTAAGAATLLLPTISGTFPSTASAPLVLNAATGALTCPTCLTSTGSFANPTATVGFTVVNGVATTAMRSDGAPALNSSIYSITSAATTLLERDANQNAFSNAFIGNGTLTASAGGTTVLTVASARFQNLTGATTQTYQLPNATTLTIGDRFIFNNNSTGLLTVVNAGSTTITTIPAGGFSVVFPTNIGTANGTWDYHILGPQTASWGTASLQLGIPGNSTNNLVFANATSGTITLQSTTGALGSSVITVPAITDTIAGFSLANGGTNANLTASNGGIVWSNATQLQILAGTATARQMLQSGATATPAWSTATWPATTSAGSFLVSATANTVTATPTPTLGVAGSVVGTLTFANATSGGITLSSPTGALGSVTNTFQAVTDTFVYKATTDSLTNKTLASSTDVLGGVTTTMGSDATGDIYYRNSGGILTRLGIGSSGQVLNVSAGLPAWSSAGATTITGPQGRLTLQSNTPVMITSQPNVGAIKYDCYFGGGKVPYFDGSNDQLDNIASCEVSDTMTAAASAGQVISGQVYDVWWVHGGANRICLAMSASGGGGGGWASDTGGSATSRGTGYTQLDNTTRSFTTNKNAISNCFNLGTNYGTVSANQGTYLGTILASANGQVSFTFGTSAAGGGASTLGVWNAANRVDVSTNVNDSTTSYTYGSTTVRAADNSNNNRITFVSGLAEDSIFTEYSILLSTAASLGSSCGIGQALDVTNAADHRGLIGNSAAFAEIAAATTIFNYPPQIGTHFVQAVEFTDGTTCTYNQNTSYGNLTLRMRM